MLPVVRFSWPLLQEMCGGIPRGLPQLLSGQLLGLGLPVSSFAFSHLSAVTSRVQLPLRASSQPALGPVFPALREVVCVPDRRLCAFMFVPARAAFAWCVPKRGHSLLRHFGDSWGVEGLLCPLVCCREGSQGTSAALGLHPKFTLSSLQLSSCLCKQLFCAPLALLPVLAAGCGGHALARGRSPQSLGWSPGLLGAVTISPFTGRPETRVHRHQPARNNVHPDCPHHLDLHAGQQRPLLPHHQLPGASVCQHQPQCRHQCQRDRAEDHRSQRRHLRGPHAHPHRLHPHVRSVPEGRTEGSPLHPCFGACCCSPQGRADPVAGVRQSGFAALR